VIRADVTENEVILIAALPQGSAAYVDRDWIPVSSGPVPAITVAADAALAWCERAPVPAPGAIDPDTAAALALLAVAQDAAGVERLPGTVEVTGNGLVAAQVRALVGDDVRAAGVDRPTAMVDTTGDPAVIGDATRRLADLGTLVLVGESVGSMTTLNLYQDVHQRGLTLVGVAPPLQRATFQAAIESDDRLLESCREMLVEVASGAPLPLDGAWYRVSG
jgi:threonine dehydrogenase-like Zn-dependent dehydrogenase